MDTPGSILVSVSWLIGGLALFLYGIDMMGVALRKAAGTALRKGLDKLTTNRFMGLLTGTVVTGLVQSSSATTVMVVGFISAGLLTFPQSIGVILGANIGTTVTPQITAFDLDELALPLLGIGFLFNLLSRKRVVKQLGLACMGVGMLFFGLTLMKTAVVAYRPAIRTWLEVHTANAVVGAMSVFLIATVATAIIQSSAATVVMIQALAVQGAIDNIEIAIPMVLGAHVGTCITALLASVRASRSAFRAAIAHLMFNVIGVLLTVLLFKLYVLVVPMTAGAIGHQIANAHLGIKLVNAMIFLPFTHWFARLITLMIPGDDKLNASPVYLNQDDIADPKKAIENVAQESRRICGMCMELTSDSITAFLERDEMLQELVCKREAIVDDLYDAVAEYVVEISRQELSHDLTHEPAKLLHIMNDVERIGDHAENIVEVAQAFAAENIKFSSEGRSEIQRLQEMLASLGEATLDLLDAPDEERLVKVLSHKTLLDMKSDEFLANHKGRLASGECSILAGIVFEDIVTNLRRISNHLRQIALQALGRREVRKA